MRWLDSITDSVDINLRTPGDSKGRETWHAAVHQVAKSWAQLAIEQQQQN